MTGYLGPEPGLINQLRAHLEEQKAMADLGTIVSSAASASTEKMENLAAIAAEGARRNEASASARKAPVPAAGPPPVPPRRAGVPAV